MAGCKNSFFLLFLFYSLLAFSEDVTPHNIVVVTQNDSTVSCVGSRLDSIMQSPTSTATMSKKECAQLAAYISASDYRCRQRFRMGLNEFNNTMWLGYDDFVHKVFDDLNLSDGAIKELWHIYLNSSWFKSLRRVKKYEKIIEGLIAQRNKERLAKQIKLEQLRSPVPVLVNLPEPELPSSSKEICAIKLPRDIESLQKEYENIPLFYDENISAEHRQRLEVREQAVDQSKEESYKQYDKSYNFSAVTDGYLRSQDLNPILYQNLCGTALQHVLHGEICEIFEQAADISSQLSYQSSMLRQATLFADIANSANRSELMPLTCAACDFSHGLVGFVLGVGRQMNHLFLVAGKQAIISTAHALSPVEIAHGLQTILTCLSDSFDCDEIPEEEIKYFEQMLCDQEFLKSKIDLRYEQVSCGVQCLSNSLESWHEQRTMAQKSQDIVGGLTDIGINIVVPDLIISKVATALGLMATNIKAVKEVEKAALFFQEEMSFSAALEAGVFLENEVEAIAQFKAGESLIAAKQEAKIKYAVTELMEAEGQAAQAAQGALKGLRPLEQIVAEVAALEGKIPSGNIVLLQEVEQWVDLLVKQSHANLDQTIVEMFSKMTKLHNGAQMPVVLDIPHILNFQYKKVEDLVNGFYTFEFEGGHLAGSCKSLEQAGLAKIIKQRMLPNGCVEYKMRSTLTGRSFGKTEFPAAWDGEKLVKSCWEVFDNPAIADYPGYDAKWIREGMVSEGFKMSLVLDPSKIEKCDIVTALPFVKRS